MRLNRRTRPEIRPRSTMYGSFRTPEPLLQTLNAEIAFRAGAACDGRARDDERVRLPGRVRSSTTRGRISPYPLSVRESPDPSSFLRLRLAKCLMTFCRKCCGSKQQVGRVTYFPSRQISVAPPRPVPSHLCLAGVWPRQRPRAKP